MRTKLRPIASHTINIKKSQASGHAHCTSEISPDVALTAAATQNGFNLILGWIKEKIHRRTPCVPRKRSCFAAYMINQIRNAFS